MLFPDVALQYDIRKGAGWRGCTPCRSSANSIPLACKQDAFTHFHHTQTQAQAQTHTHTPIKSQPMPCCTSCPVPRAAMPQDLNRGACIPTLQYLTISLTRRSTSHSTNLEGYLYVSLSATCNLNHQMPANQVPLSPLLAHGSSSTLPISHLPRPVLASLTPSHRGGFAACLHRRMSPGIRRTIHCRIHVSSAEKDTPRSSMCDDTRTRAYIQPTIVS
jgi:hypothetical protein